MKASTGYKALLRYLYTREVTTKQENMDVSEVLDELVKLEKEGGDYGISSMGDAYSFETEINLSYLDRRGMVEYDPRNPHVKLTELGRCLASRLKLPGALENAIPTILQQIEDSQ